MQHLQQAMRGDLCTGLAKQKLVLLKSLIRTYETRTLPSEIELTFALVGPLKFCNDPVLELSGFVHTLLPSRSTELFNASADNVGLAPINGDRTQTLRHQTKGKQSDKRHARGKTKERGRSRRGRSRRGRSAEKQQRDDNRYAFILVRCTKVKCW